MSEQRPIDRVALFVRPTADLILAGIVKDIRGRSGLGDVWSDLDVDVRNEITSEWRGLIVAAMKEAST